MSATAIQVPTRQEIFEKEWESLFPKQVTDNYTSSITFVKQLTAVAISTITYMKNAFPEESYKNENFAGLQLKILKQKCADGLAQFVSASLKQAFEAFDKKYVHQLALCFYNGECVPENLIEYHIFEYSYNADGVSLNINSKNRNQNSKRFSMQAIHNRTVMMIRSLSLFITTNCHEQLPLNFDISMRIYYTEDTPEDYQAPGFAECTGPDPVLDTLHTAVCLGRVETPYNKIIARTFVQGVTDTDPEPSEDKPELTQDDDFTNGSMACEVNSDSSMPPSIRCPCGKQDVEDTQELITCKYCQSQQHAVCFGLLVPAAEHCCSACAERDPSRSPTCGYLKGVSPRKQECLCIFRRSLVICSRQTTVTGEQLMGKFNLTAASTSKMLRLMQSHHIVPPDVDPALLSIARPINPMGLKLAYKRFFRLEQDTIPDRVIAETEASDPVEEALSPIEKMSLKDTNLGSVIQKPVSQPTPLKEFSEVELPSKDTSEDLPLSGSHNPIKIPRAERKRKQDDEDWTPNKLPRLRSGASKKKK